MLSTPLLQTFLAVIEAGNYSAAAERLHLSQPAVTQQIRTLEEQIGGVRLFRREGQRMVLTVAGEELLPAARELVTLAERTVQQIAALRGQVTGRVAIGCPPGSAEYLLPQLATLLRRVHSAVSIEIEIAPSDALVDRLLERRLALALSDEAPRSRRIDSRLLATERLVPVVAAGHPLAALPPPQALNLLYEHALALPRRGTVLRRTIEDALRRRGLAVPELQIALESDSLLALLAAVQHGGCLAFLPASLPPVQQRTLERLDFDIPPLQQEWQILRTREPAAAPAQLFFNLLFAADARIMLQRLDLSVS